MFHRFLYLVTISTTVALGCVAVNAEELTATGEVRLENAGEPTSRFSLHVKAVEFSSDGTSLGFAIEVDQDIVSYLQENQAQAVVQFMVDADNDKASGGKVFGSSEPGFETTTVVYACKVRDGMRVCAGDIDGAHEFPGEFQTDAWDAAANMFTPVHDLSWEGGGAEIDGKQIRAAIPYEDIGGSPGKTIRIVIATGSGRPMDTPSVLLTLK